MTALATAKAMDILHQGIVVPDYEAVLERAYGRFLHGGETVIDVGANGGRHALPLFWRLGPTVRCAGRRRCHAYAGYT